MRLVVSIAVVLGVMLGLGASGSASAGDIGWIGTVADIEFDSGTGIYTGGVIGSTQCLVAPFFPSSTSPLPRSRRDVEREPWFAPDREL